MTATTDSGSQRGGCGNCGTLCNRLRPSVSAPAKACSTYAAHRPERPVHRRDTVVFNGMHRHCVIKDVTGLAGSSVKTGAGRSENRLRYRGGERGVFTHIAIEVIPGGYPFPLGDIRDSSVNSDVQRFANGSGLRTGRQTSRHAQAVCLSWSQRVTKERGVAQKRIGTEIV